MGGNRVVYAVQPKGSAYRIADVRHTGKYRFRVKLPEFPLSNWCGAVLVFVNPLYKPGFLNSDSLLNVADTLCQCTQIAGLGKTKCRLKQYSVSDGIFLLPPKGKTAPAMDAEAVWIWSE